MNHSTQIVTINGNAKPLPAPCSILQMLQHLELSPKGIAIEVDGELVSHERFESFCLSEGAEIEIVTFVGGG